jgi:hypothetical protein
MDHRTLSDLQSSIELFFAQGAEATGNEDALAAFHTVRDALEAGELRSAEPDATAPLGWRVNGWVKRGILLGFRLGALESMDGNHPLGQSTRRAGSRRSRAFGSCPAGAASGPGLILRGAWS